MNKYIFICLLLSFAKVFAQGEANNWYFGQNAGITFNTTPPSALNDGQLSTNEGCSSISDANGNLLMYTDGRTIWNSNHQIMPNADYFGGTGLNGDPSSTSSGLIVPHPTQSNLYYVFTIDEPHHENANAYPNQGPADENGIPMPSYSDSTGGIPSTDDGFNNGLNYSVVDMNLNGGLGDVVSGEKNIELITYDITDSEEVKYKASEKITAVRGRDCNSIWLITQFRNRFYAFFIDENGIDETPVISEVPPLIEVTNYRRAALGYLKASPNADKLLVAHNTTNYNQSDVNIDAGDGNVYAYDFDNLTGEVSSPLELIDNVNAYGVEFSQDGTKAYATVDDGSAKIYQWDFNDQDVPNSRVKIADINVTTALQLGPDGKIYHSIINSSRLGVIDNPNATGNAVNYLQNPFGGAINLNGRGASFGLPPFIQSLFSERIPIVDSPEGEVIEQLQLCNDDNYTLSYEDIPTATYTWFKNDILIPNETSNTLTIEADPAQNEFPYQNSYRLEVDLNTGECPLIGVAQVEFTQSPSYEDTALEVCTETGEQAVYDLSQLQSKIAEQANISPSEFEIELYPSEADANLKTNRISETSNFVNSEALSFIVVDIFTYEACENRIDVELIANAYPDIDTTNETSIYCLENSTNPITLNPLSEGEDSSLYDFLWSSGETSSTIAVNAAGEYSVEVRFTGENCPATKTFIIQESLPEYTSENINLCDQFEYTLEMDAYPEANLTWYKNGDEILGETSTSLNIALSENAEFPVFDVYTLEVDLEDGSCIKTWDYFLEFYQSPEYKSVQLQACDSNLSGFGVFNLNDSNSQLVEGLDIATTDISLSFYLSEVDALNNQNPIQNPQNFQNTDHLNRLYAIVSGFQSCETLVEIQLSTFFFPNITSDAESFIYCKEDFPETLELEALDGNNTVNYSFLWSTSETSSTIEINTAGTYTVEIINPDTNCSLTKTFEVTESSLANFNLEVEDSSREKAIEVILEPSSLGTYEFAIDEPYNFQESKRFENLEPGIYTVYARDIQGCGISEQTVGVLGIMDFFTPNGDGINDYWKITGILNNSQENIQLQVFDRFGKLLSSFTNTSQGWDGTYNGKPMPVDDYWYRVIFTDGRVQTGSFTLKR